MIEGFLGSVLKACVTAKLIPLQGLINITEKRLWISNTHAIMLEVSPRPSSAITCTKMSDDQIKFCSGGANLDCYDIALLRHTEALGCSYTGDVST